MCKILTVHLLLPRDMTDAEVTDGLNEMFRSAVNPEDPFVLDWAYQGPKPLVVPHRVSEVEGAFTNYIPNYKPMDV